MPPDPDDESPVTDQQRGGGPETREQANPEASGRQTAGPRSDPPKRPAPSGAERQSSSRWPSGRTLLGHAIVLVLAVGLAVAPLAIAQGSVGLGNPPPERTGALDQPACTPVQNDESATAVDGAVQRVGNGTQVRVTYDLSSLGQFEDFALTTVQTGIEVVDATGFEATALDGRTYEWTGEPGPSLTYRFPTGTESGGLAAESPRFAVGPDWTLAPLPRTVEEPVTYDPEPGGVVSQGANGRRVAFVGATSTARSSMGCQTVAIHTPVGSDAVDAEGLSEAVTEAAASYPVGQRHETVHGVVVPMDGSIGGYAVGNFFTVDPSSNLSAETVAVHEYVHTRQTAEYAPEMQWFVEAQPAFYMYKLRYDAGQLSTAEYAFHLHTFHERARWGGPFETEATMNHYYRGATTLAALDYRIREATDGDRSLLDVVARLESQDGEVTTAEFKRTVEATAGRPMDGWIDRHVVAGEPVDVAAPDDGRLPRSAWETLAAYQYLTDAFPAAIAVYVLVWYGLVLFALRLAGRVGSRLR